MSDIDAAAERLTRLFEGEDTEIVYPKKDEYDFEALCLQYADLGILSRAYLALHPRLAELDADAKRWGYARTQFAETDYVWHFDNLDDLVGSTIDEAIDNLMQREPISTGSADPADT